MPIKDYQKEIYKVRKDGVRQRSRMGKAPGSGKRPVSYQDTRSNKDVHLPGSTRTKLGGESEVKGFWSRARYGLSTVSALRAEGRDERRSAKHQAWEDNLLKGKMSDLSDRKLYEARRLCEMQIAELKYGIDHAETVQEAAKKLRELERIERRQEKVATEIKQRGGPITQFYRSWRGRNPKTGKPDRRRRSSGSSRSSSGSYGGDHPVFESAGKVMTAPFESVFAFFGDVWRSNSIFK